jgi:hypothetical protein
MNPEMTPAVVGEYLVLVSRIVQHIAVVTVAIIGMGVLLWALMERYDWPLQTVLKFTAVLAFLVAFIGLFLFAVWRSS